jgi:hypothetical protein
MLEMKFAAVSALVVPWYPRSSEIGSVPASVGFAELEVIEENCCIHHGPTSFSSHIKSTLLTWVLWSVDANDSNLGE